MAEVKAYSKPPPAVETVLEAVMILRKQEPTWTEAKKQLGRTLTLTLSLTLTLTLALTLTLTLTLFLALTLTPKP